MGHLSAAEAIRQEVLVTDDNAEVRVVDFLDYVLPMASDVIYKGFEILVGRFASLYNRLNYMTERYSDVPMKRYFANKMDALITQEAPDVIIVTFPGGAKYVSKYKEMTGKDIKLYVYITDLTLHREWFADRATLYFVGSQELKNKMAAIGINSSLIKVVGIPVKQVFKIREASRIRSYRRNKEVLIMGGGFGLIMNPERVISKLLSEGNINITLIAGNNKGLREEMLRKFPQVNVIGYTDRVDRYMKRADLLITKSGGMTTFEAVNCHTPIFVLPPFLVQETGNAEFIENNGFGVVAWNNSDDIGQMIVDLLRDDGRRELMRLKMEKTLGFMEPVCPLSAYRLGC